MEPQNIQLGAILALAMALVEALKYAISYLGKNKGVSNGATEVLQKIQGNDLLHIGDAMVEQNTILKHHTELLVRIATLLEIRNKL